MKLGALASAAAFAVMTTVGSAGAATLSGAYYDVGGYNSCCSGPFTGTPLVDSATAALAFLGTLPAPTPTATFKSTGVNYGQPSTGNTIATLGDFLGADSLSLSNNGSDSFLGSILTLTGKIRLLAGANMFDVFSDDGFVLYIDGIEEGRFEGLRGPSSSTFNVNSMGGLAQVRLVYFEGSQTQAALRARLNGKILAAVPLPAGGLLLVAAIGGLAALRRRCAA